MSQPTTHQRPENGHGTMLSYSVGFLLSLMCTAIPYHLVVNKTVTGTSLLVTIVGFAFLQMIVQIFFFLHLGRGPKPLYNVVFFVATVSIVLVVVLGSIFIMRNLQYNMSSAEVTTRLAQDEGIAQVNGVKTGACQEVYTSHQVTIEKGTVTPLTTIAHRCDTLTLNNNDGTIHDIVFGQPSHPMVYGGQSLVAVHTGYSKTITLNQLGTYRFYDQFDGRIIGNFTVTP